MSQKNFYITTPDLLRQRRTPPGPRLYHHRGRCADPVPPVGRLRTPFFLTGTDEHGDKLMEACRRERERTPKAVRGQDVSGPVRETCAPRSFRPNRTGSSGRPSRSTSPVVQKILQRVYDSGRYLLRRVRRLLLHRAASGSSWSGSWSTASVRTTSTSTEPEVHQRTELFLQDVQLPGLAGRPHHQSNPGFIRPERYANEILAFLKEPSGRPVHLPAPASRLDWGITLPFDDRLRDCYVWFDALINYLTGVDWPDGENYAKILAPGVAPDGQGHYQAPRDLLADHAQGGRNTGLPTPQRPRLLDR